MARSVDAVESGVNVIELRLPAGLCARDAGNAKGGS